MKINCAHNELVDVHRLQPNPKNPNNHPDRQIELLAKIIDYQGQRSPIVVSKRSGFITKGHGRLQAIQKLGWAKAAVDYQEYDSEAQEYADIVADNKIAELAKHDDAMMIQELQTNDALADLDRDLPFPHNRMVELGYLITLRQVRVKVVLAIKHRALVDLGIEAKARAHGLPHTLLIDDRQHAGHCRIHQ